MLKIIGTLIGVFALVASVPLFSNTKEEKQVCAPYLQGNTSIPCWVIGDSCFCFPTFMSSTWMRAENYCNDWNMTLASVQNASKDQMIRNHVLDRRHDLLGESELGREYWTSGRFNTSRWIWTATGEDMKYTNWFVGQPDENSDTSCALLYFANGVQGLWADNSCRYATHFICEGDLSY